MTKSKKDIILNKNGPIIIIEDDKNDQDFLTEIFRKLNYQNKVLFLSDVLEALDYINASDDRPFLILSDINMQTQNWVMSVHRICFFRGFKSKASH